MNILDILGRQLRNEDTGMSEGSGSFDSGGDLGEASVSPSFLRDISEDDAYDMLTSFPRQLNSLESRFGEQLSPLYRQLEEVRGHLGAQTSVDPKFERLQAVLEEFDPQFAKNFMPALIEDLKASISARPLDATALEPHLAPHLQQVTSQLNQEMAMGLLDAYNISVDEIIPPVEGDQWRPETQTHKDFIRWYSMQDAAVQRALSAPGVPFARAMRQFQLWSDGRKKEKEEAAASSSARLETGRQPGASRRQTGAAQLQTELDGWSSVFQ